MRRPSKMQAAAAPKLVRKRCPCGRRCQKARGVCDTCWVDKTARNKALYQLYVEREQRRVDEAAERETAGLKPGEPLVPLAAEALVNQWMRE